MYDIVLKGIIGEDTAFFLGDREGTWLSIPIFMATTVDNEKSNHADIKHGVAFFQILGRGEGDWDFTQIVVAFITNEGQTN